MWEITGAEFTNQGVHTADGISIRFPRVTRIRHDKDWSSATSLKELRRLFEQRSDSIDLSLLLPSSSEGAQELEDKEAATKTERSSKSPLVKKIPSTGTVTPSQRPRAARKSSPAGVKYIPQEVIRGGIPGDEKTNATNPDDEERPEFYAFVNRDVCMCLIRCRVTASFCTLFILTYCPRSLVVYRVFSGWNSIKLDRGATTTERSSVRCEAVIQCDG